jgi:hypothetical protein
VRFPPDARICVVSVAVLAQAIKRALENVLRRLVLAQGGAELGLGTVPQAEQPEGTLVGGLIGILRLQGRDALRLQGLANLQTGRNKAGKAEGEFSVELDVDSIGMAFLGLDGGNNRH